MPNRRASEATTPPTSQQAAPVRSAQLAGAVLEVGFAGELGDELRRCLLDWGIMAIATCSEVKALELLRGAGLFDAVVVQFPSCTELSLHFLRQIRERRPAIPLVVVGVDADPGEILAGAGSLGACCINGTVTPEQLAHTVYLGVAHARSSGPRTSGVMPICRMARTAVDSPSSIGNYLTVREWTR